MKAIVEKIEAEGGSSFRTIRREAKLFDFHWHAHQQYELTLILHSEGKRFVGDHIGDYRSGDFVLIGPSLPHCWLSKKPSGQAAPHSAIIAQFDHTFLGDDFFCAQKWFSFGKCSIDQQPVWPSR